MANLNGFYSDSDKPNEGFEAIPAGKYLAKIVASEMKQTKSGDGEYLKLTWEIIGGPSNGRKLFQNLNLKNPNQQAVNIARSEFASIREATNVLRPNDSSDLHNIPCTINVKCKTRQDNGEMQNEIRGVSKREGAAPVAQQATQEKPWAKKTA